MKRLLFQILLLATLAKTAPAQVPFEVFAGEKRTSLDVMWFKFFKNRGGENTPVLLFNRNRATVDYENKTAFGSTNALSFNLKNGLGAVAVGQILATGFFPKLGLQFAKNWAKPHLTLFTWAVEELKNEPNTDWFLLVRAEPKINKQWRFFSQIELVNATNWRKNYNLTQRLRLGVGRNGWQIGAGADFSQTNFAGSDWLKTRNLGGFLRHVFP